MHHKGRNRHHFEYWYDYNDMEAPGRLIPVPMPDRYIAEMVIDRMAASKVYEGRNYTSASPWTYYMCRDGRADGLLHPKTRQTLERLLKMLAEEGEERTLACIKRELVKKRH